MKVFILLILIVISTANYSEVRTNLQEKIKDYNRIAQNTIEFIEGILKTSRKESALFVDKQFQSNSILKNLTVFKNTTEEYCYKKFPDKHNLNASFMLQFYQLEVPLQMRIIDIKERMNNINTLAAFYLSMDDAKYLRCSNESCNKELLKTIIGSLSSQVDNVWMTTYPPPAVRKRSTCSSDQFRCSSGSCISSSYFCNRGCDCGDCSDEPPGCVKNCYEFRCMETYRCVPYRLKCDGKDDCGDGSDEEGCPPLVYSRANCSVEDGNFLCDTKKCISIELVCNGNDDCGDGSDEDVRCAERTCSTSCGRMGRVCLRGPTGPRCLYECPLGTFETSVGCSLEPEPIPDTLAEVIEDTPRITTRYAARIKYLKMKTIMMLSKSIQEIIRCKKGEFGLLSKIITFTKKVLNGSLAND